MKEKNLVNFHFFDTQHLKKEKESLREMLLEVRNLTNEIERESEIEKERKELLKVFRKFVLKKTGISKHSLLNFGCGP